MTPKKKKKVAAPSSSSSSSGVASKKSNNDDEIDMTPISQPHEHDVLCGRGGMTNQHRGNEWFRRLVRSNRPLYRKCPKHTKLLVAKAIVQAVQQQDPPGRFLEKAKKTDKVWVQITYKRAVDKTSQALREKDTPADTAALKHVAMQMGGMEAFAAASAATADSGVAAAASAATSNNLQGLTSATLNSTGMYGGGGGGNSSATAAPYPSAGGTDTSGINMKCKKRKAAPDFVKPSWWSRGTPIATGAGTNVNTATPSPSVNAFGTATKKKVPVTVDGMSSSNKKMRVSEMGFGVGDDPLPPADGLTARQSSVIRFLNSSGLFGSSSAAAASKPQQPLPTDQTGRQASLFGMGGIFPFSRGQSQANTGNTMMGRISLQQQQQMTSDTAASNGDFMDDRKPAAVPSSEFPSAKSNGGSPFSDGSLEEVPTTGLFPSNMTESEAAAAAPPPPARGLTAQMSDWLNSFFPAGEEGGPSTPSPGDRKPAPNSRSDGNSPVPPPPPVGQTGSGSLSRSVSSTIFGLVESPSQLITSLKTGITGMFGNDPTSSDPLPVGGAAGVPPVAASVPVFGEVTTSKRESLIDDDDDENPMETKLRTLNS
eukprot:CAMPEP_0113451110 /NCGR_PEP_ID=MMETSP0014_2-20120614/6172_1 /TAXON_ID=2857 /ORGANISM="Nitzschia sp." /LENGTH=596 /DNA_ID=CAMNT_0000342461 /DNA_START=68 /DNA_END=1861 /DNA_ORIENTATION=+ /assembly_acc=CAM_ASM_000159